MSQRIIHRGATAQAIDCDPSFDGGDCGNLADEIEQELQTDNNAMIAFQRIAAILYQ
jgi:hypothetical protein